MPPNETKRRFLLREANISQSSFPFWFASLNQNFNQNVQVIGAWDEEIGTIRYEWSGL